MKNFKEKRRGDSKRGFTLIEFLIVIGLVVILSAIGLINLYGKNQSERFHSAVLRLVGTINDAVDNSKTLKNISIDNPSFSTTYWRVEFTPSGCSGGPGYSLFFSDGFQSFNYGKYVLPEGVDYDRTVTQGLPTPPSCSPNKTIAFYKNTGAPANVASAILKIYLISNPEVSSTISISSLGQVTFTSDDSSLGS